MASVTLDRGIQVVMNALRECLRERLEAAGNPVCYLPMVWGDAPLPAQRCECECQNGGNGEAWVRLVRLEQTDRDVRRRRGGPVPQDVCGSRLWNIHLEMGVWRCAPGLDDEGAPPEDDTYDAHTGVMLRDMGAVTQTWECCEFLERRDIERRLDTVSPAGPLGLCAGVIGLGRVVLEGPCPC